jgi:hypothetical protein
MSESEQKTTDWKSYPAGEADGFYVYCITESIPAAEISLGPVPAAIEEGAGLELITFKNLTAIVSRVPLVTYGEEALAEHLSDAAWTAIRAMRHEQVVEHFAKHTGVVPLRFGTIYLDQLGVERMLGEKYDELQAIIKRLQDREEWGVNVYCDRAVLLENITNISPLLREMAETAKAASPGQAYLMQKKIEALRTDESKVEIERAAKKIEERLKAHSEGVARLRILKVETTEHGELKAKFAFLVLKPKFEEFRDAAEELAGQIANAGIRIELTGPWPAYNFAFP